MTPPRAHLGRAARLALVALVVLMLPVGCSSGDKAGPPTVPSGIDRVAITVQYMSGPKAKTITDAADIAALRESVNQLPRVGNGSRTCVTDRGSWTLTFAGKGPRTTMTFDEKGCNEVRVRAADGSTQTRQGNEQLRTQLTGLIS